MTKKTYIQNSKIYDVIDSRIITEFSVFNNWLQRKTGLFSLNKNQDEDDKSCIVLDINTATREFDNTLDVWIGLTTQDEIFKVLKAIYPEIKSEKELLDVFFDLDLKKFETTFETTDGGRFIDDIVNLIIPDYAYIPDVEIEIPELSMIFGENNQTLTVNIKIFANLDANLESEKFWGKHNFYKFAKPIYDEFKDVIDACEIDYDFVEFNDDDLTDEYRLEDMETLLNSDNTSEEEDEDDE